MASRAAASDPISQPTPLAAILGVCSLLHELPVGGPWQWNSLERLLAGQPVVAHTVTRLAGVEGVDAVAVLCWDEQVPALEACLSGTSAQVIPHGPARSIPALAAVATAQSWCDGWRGGLLQTIPQDRGFFASTTDAVARAVGADAAFLVDASFALLDVERCSRLIDHARQRPGHDLYFSPLAPGLAGLLVSTNRLGELARQSATPGAALHYDPARPCLDPISADYCWHGPVPLTRTLCDFRIDDPDALAAAERFLDGMQQDARLLEAFSAATANSVRRSTSSPQRSIRTGVSAVEGNTSTMEPRTAISPRCSTWYSRRYPPSTRRRTRSSGSSWSPGFTLMTSTSST